MNEHEIRLQCVRIAAENSNEVLRNDAMFAPLFADAVIYHARRYADFVLDKSDSESIDAAKPLHEKIVKRSRLYD